ncbi:MAG: LysM peptidoglycan-binding domain-containing protein [Bdellovibrionales bacterium]|nr:LysM peptidoglycan-binding domain-containing protein [Bdellovibrionales bacterium]
MKKTKSSTVLNHPENPISVFKSSTILGCFVILLSGCASWKLSHDSRVKGKETDAIQISGKENASKEIMNNLSTNYQSAFGDIPLDLTPLTKKWIDYFQGKGRKHMMLYLERSARYLPMMKNTLRENSLPEDLVYIALIESGFSPRAHSRANAVGYWQFIRSTGKRYGLKVDPFIDERRDPVLSTRAAAEYFKTLYGMFNSWHLSLAAYNVGENRVKRAVQTYYTKDYWELVKKRRAFPKETRHYVAKFIAAALIAKNPAQFGFEKVDYQAPLAFDTVSLINPISMSKLALKMNVSVDDLQMLNPKFRGDFVPQYRGSETLIRVPVGMVTLASQSIPEAFSEQPKVLQTADFTFYKVKKGDTLSTIARRHRVSLVKLRQLNNYQNKTLLRVGSRVRVPDRGGEFISYVMPVDTVNRTLAGDKDNVKVKDIENEKPNKSGMAVLSSVAKVEGERVVAENTVESEEDSETAPNDEEDPASPQYTDNESSEGSEENISKEVHQASLDLKNKKIKSETDSIQPSPKVNDLPSKNEIVEEPTQHIVRRGENLTLIAHKYGLSVSQLKKINKLPRRSVLRAGQTLILKTKEESGDLDSKPSPEEGTFRRSQKGVGGAKVASLTRLKEGNPSSSRGLSSIKESKKIKATHLVRRGETLADIARRYRISVGALARHNLIKNKSRLIAGRALEIPFP